MSFPSRDRELRDKLDRDVKPIFSKYEATGGIPLQELKDILGESDLPRERISYFVRTADEDKNDKVSYDEFLEHLLKPENDVVFRKLRMGKRVLNKIVMGMDPSAGHQRIQHQISKLSPDAVDSTYNWGEEEFNNYLEAYNCLPPPLFMPFITLIQIAFFVYYAIVHYRDNDPFNDVTAISGAPLSSPLIYNPRKRYQVWRFLTYMLLHNGYWHLAFNCFTQLLLGTLLELVHNFWRVGIVYLLGVVAGSLAHSVTDPYTFLVGASGGGYALMGAHLANVIMNWKEMQSDWLKNPANFISSGVFRLCLVLLLAGGDTAMAIYSRFVNQEQSKIGISAHIGGFIAGLLLGVPVLRNLKVEKWEKVCFWVCIVLYIIFSATAIVFNVVCISYNTCPNVIY